LLFGGGFHTLEDVAFGEMESLKNSSGINDNEDIERIQHAARTALQEKLRNISVDEESEEEETEDKL